MRERSYEQERARSDQHMHLAQEVLRQRPWIGARFRASGDTDIVIEEANPFEDRARATDLVLTWQTRVAIGVRCRRYTRPIIENDDMAFRTMGPDDRPRELQHILAGYPDVDVYIVMDPSDRFPLRVWVVDLRRFAAYAKQVMAAGARPPWNEHRNGPERFVTVTRDTLEAAGAFIDEIRPDDELATTERVADLLRTAPWFRQLPEDDQPRVINDLKRLVDDRTRVDGHGHGDVA